MKRRYIHPNIYFEDIETDGIMNGHPSQWNIIVDNEAPDNDDVHGGDLGGSDNNDPEDPPIWGD